MKQPIKKPPGPRQDGYVFKESEEASLIYQVTYFAKFTAVMNLYCGSITKDDFHAVN
jgi:hypothetical protein